MALLFVMGGYFLNLVVFTSLVVIHEISHYLVARMLKFRVVEIVIYPYGGMTKLDDFINRRIDEELLIAVSGVIGQYLFYLVILFLYKESIIREYTYSLFELYNGWLIFFNLLPIYPLDGGRIVNLLLGKVCSYNWSNRLTFLFSLIFIGFILGLNVYEFNYSNVIIFVILFGYLVEYVRSFKYLYNKFMLERYLYGFKFDKFKIINSKDGMYRDREHLLYRNGSYREEKDFLRDIFYL